MFYPSEKDFIRLAKKGNLIPVYKEIMADMETPVSAFKKIEGEYSFLLESVEGGEKIARYSFLGTCPREKVITPGSFSAIKDILRRYRPVKVPGVPRFAGGLVGFISYDAVREIEPKLKNSDKNLDDLKLPLMQFLLTDKFLAFDHIGHKILIINNAIVDKNPKAAYRRACREICELENQLGRPLKPELGHLALAKKNRGKLKIKSNFSRQAYMEIVKKAKEEIRAGEIIQVVPSQRFETACRADSFKIYRALRTINPSPYMFYLKLGGTKMVGSSPEVMVRLEKGEATLRPIAGTRPRGADEEQDAKLVANLLASKKERAEHIMLVDLGRNDLGRVCANGTVKVTEEMVVEKYSHVMHIVSNVTGKMKKNKDSVDLLKATFPAGTVSGAPKVRAMEIIDQLENQRRGPYAGCVGYFDFFGDLDMAITIRTIIIKNNRAYVQAGGGVVADSDPGKEYQETVNKAKALLTAVAMAND